MKTDSINSKALSEAIRWVRDYPRIEDYRNGLRLGFRDLPDNLVLFSRSAASALANDPHNNHHYRYLLIIALEGNGAVVLDRRLISVPAQSAILVQPMQFHHYTGFDSERITWLFVGFEGTPCGGVQEWRSRAVPLTGTAVMLINRIGELWHSHEKLTNRNREIPFVVGWLLAHLASFESKPAADPDRPLSGGTQPMLPIVNAWLGSHPPDQWSAEALAADCGYSLRQLHRLFQKETSIPIGRYVREQRAAFALKQIYAGRRISDVAEAAGFSSIYTFSRAFKQMFGASPRDYLRASKAREADAR